MNPSPRSYHIDFVISNGGHHPAAIEPVIKTLTRRSDVSIRVISFCEFRGIVTPAQPGNRQVVTNRIVPFRFRRASTGGQSGIAGNRQSRQIVRSLSWYVLLNPSIRRWLETYPDLVVLPNDSAFPYDRLACLLHKYDIPFTLLQEGIRFPLPTVGGDSYGQNGASAIAAWGESSAKFFMHQGVLESRIHLTGSPRYDSVFATDWRVAAESTRKEMGLGHRNLLLLTNPIDDQGFCSTLEKMKLVRVLLEAAASLFEDPQFSFIIKLHGRESLSDYMKAKEGFEYTKRVHIRQQGSVYPLIAMANAAVVFASTVGLEALMLDCPLGVMEVPGHGFVHDYVSSGAALGLNADDRLPIQLGSLMVEDPDRIRLIRAYVTDSLSNQGRGTEHVAALLLHQLEH